jgi:hypothetical protein
MTTCTPKRARQESFSQFCERAKNELCFFYNYLLHVSTNNVIVRRSYYKNTQWEAEE